MTVLVLSEFDVTGLSVRALKVMRAALLHAEKNRPVQLHRMGIEAFCELAGFPLTSVATFWQLLREASRTLVIVQNIDTSSRRCDVLPGGSWPVFNGVWIDGCDVIFEVCNRTFDDGLLATLPNLRPSSRRSSQRQCPSDVGFQKNSLDSYDSKNSLQRQKSF